MAQSPGAGDEQEECGPLVFQRGKKLSDEYYIISVRDNAESACVKFSAYELESSETFELSYTYTDFDALFRVHPELVNPANKEGRYDWVIDRLDFTSNSSGSAKRLALGAEPTAEDESGDVKTVSAVPKVVQKDRLTYAERQRLRIEAEKLEEKRAANIAMKSEKNRKAFVAELQEKRKLEELKVASRRQRIDEERAERREKAEMQKHINEERSKRYEENDKKRDGKIDILIKQRKERDLANIQDIIHTAQVKSEATHKKLDDARQRKVQEEASQAAELVAKREAEKQIEDKREGKIEERNSRLKQAECEYLQYRKDQIELIKKEKQDREVKKEEYLREKAAQRAQQLREKHKRVEDWERLDDLRTQNNMTKEHTRNMQMLEHIEGLRQTYSQQQYEADERKSKALEERKTREAQVAQARDEVEKKKLEQAQKREANISEKESKRAEANQEYCKRIRDLKTAEALRVSKQREDVEQARDKNRDDRLRERQCRGEQEMAAASINAQREENIRKIERDRDLKFAHKVKEQKEKELQHSVEIEGRKLQKRQQDREKSDKYQEEQEQKKRQMQSLDEQREAMIKQRALERNKREQDRLQNGPGGTSPTSASAAPAASPTNASAAPEAAQSA